MTKPVSIVERIESIVDPLASDEKAEAVRLGAFLDRVLWEGRGGVLESTGTFPESELREFAKEGFIEAFVPEKEGGKLDWARAMRIATRFAAHDLDTTLCLGGTVLASIPVLLAGTSAQRARFFAMLREGEMAALALSEMAHGSDLLGGTCRARPLQEGSIVPFFVFDGEKAPANNATVAKEVVVLARTSDLDGATSHSLFLVPRDTDGVTPLKKLPSLGYRSMDLSGIRFDKAKLPTSALLGNVGEGFLITRRALEISRSGVAMMAVGAHAIALAHAVAHAKERKLYGAPIAELGGVRRLVAAIASRLILAMALGRRAARTIAAFGAPGRALSSAAKLLCPDLLERSVHDAGTILGARSLFTDLPFARLRRAAPVLAIFDGSSQLQLDELWRHAGQWSDAEPTRKDLDVLWDERRRAFTSDLDDHGLVARLNPQATLHAFARHDLGPVVDAAQSVGEAARSLRGMPQEIRFRASEAVAWVQGLATLVEARENARRTRAEDAALLHAALSVAVADVAPLIGARLVELATSLGRPKIGTSAKNLVALAGSSIEAETKLADAFLK